MAIDLVAYAFVEPKVKPVIEFHRLTKPIRHYFDEHLDALAARGADSSGSGDSDPARFRPLGQGHQRFKVLQAGTRAEFKRAAQELADSLADVSDQRMNRGVFVALRRSNGHPEPEAAVLKLDVYNVPAVRIGRLAHGLTLEAVVDLLDLPGDLHKGALYPDVRPESDVIVVDRYRTLFFLKSIEAQQLLTGNQAAGGVVGFVETVAPPERVAEIVDGLADRDQAFAPRDIIPDLDLTPEQQEAALTMLEEADLTLGEVDPALMSAVVRADGIEVRGPARLIKDRVRWQRHARFGWRITVDVAQKPVKTFGS